MPLSLREVEVRRRGLRPKNPLKPAQQGVAPVDTRVRRECSRSRDRQAEQHRDILQSRGHLPEREVEGVRLGPPTVHQGSQERPVERESS